jgi:predicted Mrr-cat superfamily restriction endonuclease
MPESAVASKPEAAVAATPQVSAESKKAVLKDIRAKWGKFSEQDLSAIKDKDDLVTQIVAKYSLDKGQVQRDVEGLLKGREI